MRQMVWLTAVAIVGLLLALSGCISDSAPAAPELAHPAFLYFYTDN